MTHGVGARHVAPLTLALLLLASAGCGTGSDGTPFDGSQNGVPADGVSYLVRDTAGLPVVGATVYLVPAEAVNAGGIVAGQVLDGSAEDRDEPLEDAVRLDGASFPQAVTDATGRADIATLPPGRYFRLVVPAVGDVEHFPGASDGRLSLEHTVLRGRLLPLTLSSRAPADAVYLGTKVCLICHADLGTTARHAHKLGLCASGTLSPQQDASHYPDFEGGWDTFLPAASYVGGTPVWFSDYDGARGVDKFKTSLSDPSPGETVYLKVWLWRDTTDGMRFKATIQNVINPADPRSPWTLAVPLTYGGAVAQQLALAAVPGRKGRYPLLQWQTQGRETYYDRTRKVFRDQGLGAFFNAGAQALQDPAPTETFEGRCTGCHATGFRRFQDAGTGEWLCDAVNNSDGAFDIDGDGKKDEINVGCEGCHGPGSGHTSWVVQPEAVGREARFILRPDLLSPSREVLVCGRCHDRPVGQGTIATNEPLNAANEMPPPGISRAEYLASYVSRKGPALGDFWSDQLHSLDHYQQYSDFLKSPMHRNDRVLTVCSDCHGNHGDAPFEAQLRYDPDDVRSLLCRNCHILDVGAHTLEKVGVDHAGFPGLSCVKCHQPETAKSGAGHYGLLAAPPTGGPSDVDEVYWVNDIAAHHFVDVPRKGNPDVSGVVRGEAMPIPYTSSCGAPCHQASSIPAPKPGAR